MIADFRRQGHFHGAIRIQGEKVEVVLKYPGTIFEDTRKWDFNTEATTKKGTSDSICCGSSDLLTLIQLFLRSSDLLTLIQLFLSCFITLWECVDLFFYLLVLSS